MFQSDLFFGFPLEASFFAKLNALDPKVINLYIQNDPNYLQRFIHNKKTYLGKFVGKKVELSHLELLEANIYSLLRKIVPDFPYENTPLELFPIEETNASF